ncbi:MAG TPA: ACP S-malonyltransferase [Ruminiclostridium sp.]|nr:ACP S-malonyltransferase [Ruminiclostridium sp.]
MERIAFLFTGQGAQFIGMGKMLYDKYTISRQTFEEAGDVLGFDMARLCFEDSLTNLSKTENAQPAILTASVAAYRAYMQEIGIPPEYCAGHSFGEYSALTCAGALRFSEAVRLVRARGLLCARVAASGTGAMTIVEGVTQEVVEEECSRASDKNGFASINVFNDRRQFSIAGHQEAVERAETALLERGANITPLLMSAPFHSRLMEPIVEELYSELLSCKFKKPRCPVISNVTGLPYRNKEEIARMLVLQAVSPVQWTSSMKYLFDNGITLAIEMGPKNVLTNLVKSNTPEIRAFCYGQPEHRNKLHEILETKSRARKKYHTVISSCLAAAIATPNCNSNKDEYIRGVIEPYRIIERMQAEQIKQGTQPSVEEMKYALRMLRIIFNTKGVSLEEQEVWFENMLDETGTNYLLGDFVKIMVA